MSLILRGIKGSALTHAELDNNLVWLKSRDIVDASFNGSNLILTKDDTSFYSVPIGGGSSGNMWFIPSGTTVTVPTNFQSFIYGDLYVEGTLDLQSNSQLVVLNGDLYLTGGTITGTGTVYVVESDNYVTGGTYSNGTLTLDRQNGSINISGFLTGGTSSSGTSVTGFTYNNKNQFSISQSDGTTLNATINIVTGLTSTGDISVNNLTVGKGGGNIASNTVFGNQSLPVNTTGYSNTTIGSIAMYSNTTGFNNTSVGNQSLYSNTTGNYNTSVGSYSLTINSTGSNNIAIGHNSLYYNNADNNLAVGYESLYKNTLGIQNVGIGQFSLHDNTTGGGNTAIGFSSSLSNTVGIQNTSVGNNSLSYNQNGSNNTAIGCQALNYNTGSTNTAVGSNTSSGNFDGSIILGVDASATANNQFVVGSTGTTAGVITVESLTPTVSWTVKINGVDYKIPLQIA